MKDGIEKRQKLAKQELEETLAGINKQERDTLKKMEEAEKKGVKITPEEKKGGKNECPAATSCRLPTIRKGSLRD